MMICQDCKKEKAYIKTEGSNFLCVQCFLKTVPLKDRKQMVRMAVKEFNEMD